jgi:peptidoglycan/xylan/chitin deacetylase (PgdA/CDA1 family)
VKNFKNNIDSSILGIIEKISRLINPLVLRFANENNHLLVYYFHGIYENNKQKELNHVDPQNNLTVTEFKVFIDYFLSNNYLFIKPEDILNGLPENNRYILLTFDDGYFNNTLAIKILNEYKIPATFFISTNNIVNYESFWWDIIFKYRIKEGITLRKIRDEQSYLKKFKYHFIDSYIVEQFGADASKPWSDIDRPLTIEELRNISKNPLVTIGNHTHNHTILTLYNANEITEQFRKSSNIFSEIIGLKPKFVGFPNGNFNPEILKICKEQGFSITFSTVKKLNTLPIKFDNNIVNLNRLMAQTGEITTYGSFDRLGYTPASFYLNLKRSINIFK